MPNPSSNMSLASSGTTMNPGISSVAPKSSTPAQNASYPMSTEPKKTEPLQNASYPMSVEPEKKAPIQTQSYPMSTEPKIIKPPAVITAQPAVENAQKQIAEINKLSDEAEAKKVDTSPVAPDTSYTSQDPAVRAKIEAMSKEAETYGKTPPPPAPIPPTPKTGVTDIAKSNVPTVETLSGEKTVQDSYIEQLRAQDEQSQTYLDDYIKTSQQIMGGAFPLTPDQQAQIDGITQQYEGMIAEQRSINQSYQNGLTMAGVSSGRSMYAPEIELGNINAAVAMGAQKIAGLNADMLSSIAEAKSAIKTDNMKLLDSTYKHIGEVMAQRRDTIKEAYVATQDAITAAKEDYKTMREEIEAMASVGKDPSEFSEGFFNKLDMQREKMGLPSYEGYTKDLYQMQYDASKATAEAESDVAAIERATKLNDILSKIPVGSSIEIAGVRYEGRSRGEIKTGTETAPDGRVTFWKYNPDTGEVDTTNLGNIGRSEDGWQTEFDDNGQPWRINSRSGEIAPYFPSYEQTNIQSLIPDGSTSPFLDANGNPRTQCGAFTNDLLHLGVGDTVESKLNKTDPSIKAGSSNPPQVGDMFVQSKGFGWTGHVGIVAGVEIAPDGSTKIRCFESNYPQKDKITSSRTVDASEIAGFGRTDESNWSPMLKELFGGTDMPAFGAKTPTFGAKTTTAEKPLSASEIKTFSELGYDVKPGMTLSDMYGMTSTGKSGKPKTPAQAKVLTYANRTKEANEQMLKIEEEFMGATSLAGKWSPNIWKSENRQLFEQSQRNFINAVLRRESGAAIAPSEFSSAEKQYFAQPGDSQSVLEQKRLNRNTVISGFMQEAGESGLEDESQLSDDEAYAEYLKMTQ